MFSIHQTDNASSNVQGLSARNYETTDLNEYMLLPPARVNILLYFMFIVTKSGMCITIKISI